MLDWFLSSPGERPQSSAIDEVEGLLIIVNTHMHVYIVMQNSTRNVVFIRPI